MNATLRGRLLTFFIFLSLGFAFGIANAADPVVVSTWKGGIHFLPASATQSGNNENVDFENDETLEQWNRRLTQEIIKPGLKVPAVIYVHGCTGPLAAPTWAVPFNDFGFAFFAPDSFKRPGRVSLCYQGDPSFKAAMRREEIKFALAEVRKLSWIDQKRLVLVGKSEGGMAVSEYGGEGFIAHIIMAYDCRHIGGSQAAPGGVAVLNLVGANDRREDLCSVSREVGGSKAISLSGYGHSFEGAPEATAAVATFLKDCCGYKPVSATGGLDENATAKKLVEELGGMATIDAMMKAEEAAGKGDEEGHAFWVRVHEIAMKLITGG